MNNNLQIKGNNPFEIFNYSNLGKVRTTKSPTGEVLFCLTDVCKILGYTNPYNMVNKVNSDYLYSMEGVSTVTNQHGVTYEQVSMMNFVNLFGLFQAIGKSRKPEAEKFMNWVYSVVLPSIAKNGSYSISNDPTFRLNGKDYKPNLTGFVQWVGDTLENHENRLGTCESTLTQYGNQLQDNRAITDDLSSSIGTMLHHSAVTIAGFINLYKLPINPSSENLRNLGLQAKQLTESRGFTVGSIYDERWGKVNVYPVDILQELFSTIS